MRVHCLGNKVALNYFISGLKTPQEQLDFITLRNGILLYNALKNDRCRENDVVFHGFDHIQKHYPYHCLE